MKARSLTGGEAPRVTRCNLVRPSQLDSKKRKAAREIERPENGQKLFGAVSWIFLLGLWRLFCAPRTDRWRWLACGSLPCRPSHLFRISTCRVFHGAPRF